MPQDADVENLLEEMIEQQTRKVLELGRRWVPHATSEDLRNSEDFAILKDKPIFHFEEGILAGLIAARTALVHQARTVS
jgi:predicted hydrocarbon binding protein